MSVPPLVRTWRHLSTAASTKTRDALLPYGIQHCSSPQLARINFLFSNNCPTIDVREKRACLKYPLGKMNLLQRIKYIFANYLNKVEYLGLMDIGHSFFCGKLSDPLPKRTQGTATNPCLIQVWSGSHPGGPVTPGGTFNYPLE